MWLFVPNEVKSHSLTAFSKPAGCRLNEPPSLEVRPSPFQAENVIFVLLSKKKKETEKTPQKKVSDNNLKVSVPTVFPSLEFLKTQTSFRSFFNYKSGNIHRPKSKLELCVNTEAGLVILLQMTVNKVVQIKYNFDALDPPWLHQMAPLSFQFSKNFWGGMPPDPLKVHAPRELGRVPSPPWPPPSSEWPAPKNLFEKAD